MVNTSPFTCTQSNMKYWIQYVRRVSRGHQKAWYIHSVIQSNNMTFYKIKQTITLRFNLNEHCAKLNVWNGIRKWKKSMNSLRVLVFYVKLKGGFWHKQLLVFLMCLIRIIINCIRHLSRVSLTPYCPILAISNIDRSIFSKACIARSEKSMAKCVLNSGLYCRANIRVFCNFHYASITRMRRELAHFSRVLRFL